MHGNLFWRIFTPIILVMLLTVAIFSALLAAALQQSRQISYENEVRLQANEIAESMTHRAELSSVRDNVTMEYIIRRKINDIHQKYNADIWIVSQTNSGQLAVQYLDSSWKTSEATINDDMAEQFEQLLSGQNIRVTDMFSGLGEDIITIGVPWVYRDGNVVGAVLLHISTNNLKVSAWEIVPLIAPAAAIVIVLGFIISVIIARRQTRPLREIDSAVREFSKGDLTRRVDLHCGGELEELGNSINRMAEELSQLEDSRRHFVAAVSHELRSPMTCMRGYVEAMLDGTISDDERPHYLQVVLSETKRLTDLVHDLLEISRYESGKFPLTIAPFDANELVCRILITFETRISDKHIDVDAELCEAPCWAEGDASRLTQVISNFVDNAVKFLPDGGKLRVSTEKAGKNVRFTVWNNGPAISEKDLPHIFERFYKADSAHTSGTGTGLGLSICALIVREHKSEIEVTSTDEGTQFSFMIPACSPSGKAKAEEALIEE